MPISNDVKSVFQQIQSSGKANIYHAPQAPQKNYYMENKENEAKSSEVLSIVLDKPISIKLFKQFSKTTRRDYMMNLYKRFPGLDTASVANMLGTTSRMMKMELGELGITPPNGNSKTSQASREKFKEFVKLPYQDGSPAPTLAKVDEVVDNPGVDLSHILVKVAKLQAITFDEFKALPEAKRNEYIQALYKKYPGISVPSIMKLFNISRYNADKYVSMTTEKFTYEERAASIAKFDADMLGIISMPAPVEEKKELPFKNTNKKIESKPIVMTDTFADVPVEEEQKPVFVPKINPNKFTPKPVEIEPAKEEPVMVETVRPEPVKEEPKNETSVSKINTIDIVIDAENIGDVIKALNLKGKVRLQLTNVE